MERRETMNTKKHIKISELAEVTQLPISTIKYYIREGLLPKREKTGKTAAYFTDVHIERLKFIQKLKDEKKLAIKEIKETIREQNGREYETVDPNMIFSSKRQDITRAAIQVFTEHGFHHTSVSDIVIQAGVSRKTFYSFYKNKEVLFLECADKIVQDLISQHEANLKTEPDVNERFRKRLEHMYFLQPYFIDMLNIVKVSAIDSELFSLKFKQVMQSFVDVLVKELESAPGEAQYGKMDAKLISYLLIGITEYGFHFMKHEPDVAFEDIFKQILHFFSAGYSLNSPEL